MQYRINKNKKSKQMTKKTNSSTDFQIDLDALCDPPPPLGTVAHDLYCLEMMRAEDFLNDAAWYRIGLMINSYYSHIGKRRQPEVEEFLLGLLELLLTMPAKKLEDAWLAKKTYIQTLHDQHKIHADAYRDLLSIVWTARITTNKGIEVPTWTQKPEEHLLRDAIFYAYGVEFYDHLTQVIDFKNRKQSACDQVPQAFIRWIKVKWWDTPVNQLRQRARLLAKIWPRVAFVKKRVLKTANRTQKVKHNAYLIGMGKTEYMPNYHKHLLEEQMFSKSEFTATWICLKNWKTVQASRAVFF